MIQNFEEFKKIFVQECLDYYKKMQAEQAQKAAETQPIEQTEQPPEGRDSQQVKEQPARSIRSGDANETV